MVQAPSGQSRNTVSNKINKAVLDYYYYFGCTTACWILVPQPGMEPTPPVAQVWNLNHWTTREVPAVLDYSPKCKINIHKSTRT